MSWRGHWYTWSGRLDPWWYMIQKNYSFPVVVVPMIHSCSHSLAVRDTSHPEIYTRASRQYTTLASHRGGRVWVGTGGRVRYWEDSSILYHSRYRSHRGQMREKRESVDALGSYDTQYSYQSIRNKAKSDDLREVKVYPWTKEITGTIEKLSEKEHNRENPHPHISDESLWKVYLVLYTVEQIYREEWKYGIHDRERECRILEWYNAIRTRIVYREPGIEDDPIDLSTEECSDIAYTRCYEKSGYNAIPVLGSLLDLVPCLVEKYY